MDNISFYALFSAIVGVSAVYIIYVLVYYILLTRHPSLFRQFNLNPPVNISDWYIAQIYTTSGAVTINVLFIIYMVRIAAPPSLIAWIVWLCIMESAFIYILYKERKQAKSP